MSEVSSAWQQKMVTAGDYSTVVYCTVCTTTVSKIDDISGKVVMSRWYGTSCEDNNDGESCENEESTDDLCGQPAMDRQVVCNLS